MKLTVEIEGDTTDDLTEALEEITDLVREGHDSGVHNKASKGRVYRFDITEDKADE